MSSQTSQVFKNAFGPTHLYLYLRDIVQEVHEDRSPGQDWGFQLHFLLNFFFFSVKISNFLKIWALSWKSLRPLSQAWAWEMWMHLYGWIKQIISSLIWPRQETSFPQVAGSPRKKASSPLSILLWVWNWWRNQCFMQERKGNLHMSTSCWQQNATPGKRLETQQHKRVSAKIRIGGENLGPR